MNNPKHTPEEAIRLIDKELDELMKEEWDSDTLPNLVEWLGMVISHTEINK